MQIRMKTAEQQSVLAIFSRSQDEQVLATFVCVVTIYIRVSVCVCAHRLLLPLVNTYNSVS